MSVLLVACIVAVTAACSAETEEAPTVPSDPNVILILTDDLDVDSVESMPNLQRYLVDEGTTFENAFTTFPLCCPARASILRGQYAHNHGVLANKPPTGGHPAFVAGGNEDSTVATWLDDGGYGTALFGKYLNHTPREYEVPGWDTMVNGGYTGADAYHTDWYADEAESYIRDSVEAGDPFFVYLGTKAPHKPALPAPRHEGEFADARAPRTPSFDEEDVSDKPEWVRQKSNLTERKEREIDALYRNRLRSMLAVDDMIGQLVEELERSGELDDTYIFFTSDSGFAMGQHRRPWAKGAPYEEVIRIPLYVRGPAVPAGATREHMVTNNDLAPTFAELADVPVPGFVDGRSFVSLLKDDPPPKDEWRTSFLVQGEANGKSEYPSYRAVRTADHVWIEWATGERELYDLREDPHQLQSIHETADAGVREDLERRLDALRGCSGEACRRAEDGASPSP